jgi:hypothetical protein
VLRPLEWLELRAVGTRTAHDHRLTRAHCTLFFLLRVERKWHGVSKKSWVKKLGQKAFIYSLSVHTTQRKIQDAGDCLQIQPHLF